MVLAGDAAHLGYAFDLRETLDDLASRTVGTEFVTTSVSSGGDGVHRPAGWDAYLTANPHPRFHDGRRGYVRVELGRAAARAGFRTASAVTTPVRPSRRPRPS